MPIPLYEGLTLAEVRQRLAQVIRARRKLGQEVTKIGELEYEFQFTDPALMSDMDGVLRAEEEPPRYGWCVECGSDLEEDGRNTRYCPSCDTCEECGCFDGHNAGCDLADTEEIEG